VRRKNEGRLASKGNATGYSMHLLLTHFSFFPI
jgi:hypothetical protein